MSDDVIVWNTDARNRPELEVEIEIVLAPSDVPGEHYARSRPDIEVELLLCESIDLIDLPVPERLFSPSDLAVWSTGGLFLPPDEADPDALLIYDAPPPGYRNAYAAA